MLILCLNTPHSHRHRDHYATGPVSISCKNITTFLEMYVNKTSFYIFVNKIVCVDAKCTRLKLSMLYIAVITKIILKCSTRERIRLAFH